VNRIFKPNFRYTDKIVKNLVDIASAREAVLNSYLIPKWEVSLRKDALIRASHASTAIEGNPLTIEEVSMLAHGRKVLASRKAELEVLNYLKVLEKIEVFQQKGRVTSKNILKLHKYISKDILEKPEYEGRYRELQVYVGNNKTGDVIFMPPQPDEVPGLMTEFLKWVNSEDAKKLDPVMVAGISHYEFVRIHPFVDGNGRTARSLATLILYLREFDIKRFFALEYFTDGVLISIAKVKEKVLRLSLEKHKRDSKGQVSLTERQMKIIETLQKNGKIRAGEVAKMFGVTRQAALKELHKLVEPEVIRLEGKGRGAYYVMA